jgi:glycolate oxidase iron-sulfur subunit
LRHDIKDYGFMLPSDPAYAQQSARIAGLAQDITEYLVKLDRKRPLDRTFCAEC